MGPDFAPDEFPRWSIVRGLPRGPRFAVEVRQTSGCAPMRPDLLALLAEHGMALALSDGRWIPRETMTELAERPTADFHYVRWMGPNRDITDYSHLQFDRSPEIREWSDVLRRVALGTDLYGYFNNHFAGHSPANARELQSCSASAP